MKKVGIVTIFDLNNYGNRLQNYAMEQIFLKKGVIPTSIVLKKYNDMFKYDNRMSHWIKKIYVLLRKDCAIKRYLSFLEFQRNMNTRVVNNTAVLNSEFDFFVVGSDQVWHPKVIDDDFLLKFAKPHKRIAVSPSIGVDKIPDDTKRYYKEGIEAFAYVSIREESGKEIIQEISSKDILQICDPVFMLNDKEWDEASKKLKEMPESYILKYSLGDGNSVDDKWIERVAKEKGLEIIDIYNEKSKYFTIGPGEFIYLIKNAELVCTNSFHALAFCLIYNINFVIFERYEKSNDMNTRVNTLLTKFSMNHRKKDKIKEEELFKTNFSNKDAIIDREQKKFEKFIEQII